MRPLATALTLTGMLALPSVCPAQVEFDWVIIGDPGNPPDPLTGFGSVDYEYRIASTEVTNGQYVEFLNAVAASDNQSGPDFNLWDQRMGFGHVTIQRHGEPGSYTYTTDTCVENMPVRWVSFFDAIRFANWMHNGQKNGDTETGAYDLIEDGIVERRLDDARFFLPSENEWYKAAYYQPTIDGGDVDSYWLYPTSSNNPPALDSNNRNVEANMRGQEFPFGSSRVGIFPPNYYGLFDMAGNALEWNETVIGLPGRGQRGGSWNGPQFLRSDDRGSENPSGGQRFVGFRLAAAKAATDPCSPADVTTDGTNPGDTLYGVPDGQVTAADLTYFVEVWLAGCS